MFKNIFSKLIVVFIAILILSFSITGVMLYYFLGDFVLKDKVKVLDQSADNISYCLNMYAGNPQPQYLNLLDNVMQRESINTKSIIWIVSNTGELIKWQGQTKYNSMLQKKLIQGNGHLQLPDVRQYEKVMIEAKSANIQEMGDFYGLFKDTHTSWLTIEKPFKFTNLAGIQTSFAIFIHTPIPEVQRARNSVIWFFLISVCIGVIVSICLIYIFSLRISKPLKEIKNAAKLIAGGEFEKRLNIKSQDEIGELANSFNQMAFALQHLEEMRRGFIANVSHELRTPMTSIRGFIEGILDGTIPVEKQRDYLSIVKDETSRLNRLVNDLLDLARIESGEVVLNYKNFEINELIRISIIKLEGLIVQKDIHVEANFEVDKMFVYADRDAIERVIINLVHNAIKFTDINGQLTLTTSYHKDKVRISVSDDGIGIDKEEIDLIWDRFYKSDKSRGNDRSGTGLGLAIIKSTINEHGESIWVESEISKGTKFTFTLCKGKEEEEL